MFFPEKSGMKTLVVGAGAIGSLLGGFLAHGGFPVAFIEPAAFAQQLAEQGLILHNHSRTIKVSGFPVYRDPGDLPQESYQLMILAVKAYDIIPTLNALLPYREKFEQILVPQNGLGNEERVAAFFPPERIISAAITIPVGILRPGEIKLAKKGGLGLSGYAPNAKITAVKTAFLHSGLTTHAYANWQAMKWSKLLLNILGNASCAILSLSPGEVYSHARMVEIEQAAFNEAIAVMKAKKIPRIALPGYSLKLLENLFAWLPPELLSKVMSKPMNKSRGSKMPSLYLDLQGTKSEIGVLNGAIVQAGKETGIATPANLTLTQILEQIMKGDLNRNEFKGQPEKLWLEYLKRKGIS